MIYRETCEYCKGDRFVRITTGAGKSVYRPCPHCGGVGYKVRSRR